MPIAMIMPKKYFFDKNNQPLAFGKIYTYQTQTTTNKPTFTTEGGSVENTNPVILNGEGYASIYIEGSYNIVVDDANDNNIWTEDPVSSNIAEEWIGCEVPVYVSTTSFKITGNVTEIYEVNRRIRIDNNTAEFSYSAIDSSSFAAGETTVVISDPVVAVGIIEVCVSIIGENSTPKHNHDKIYARTFTSITAMVDYTEHVVDNNYIVHSPSATAEYIVDTAGDIALFGGLFAKRNSQLRTYGAIEDMISDVTISLGDTATFRPSETSARGGVNNYKVANTEGESDGENIIDVQDNFQALQDISVADGEKRSMMVRSNMHFGTLKGMPFATGELGASQTYVLSTDANVGDMSINLVDATGIVPNQLMCYKSEFGNYYSFVAKGRIGNLLELRSPIEEFLSSGGDVFNFYTNSSHPNSRGNNTIVDYALRDIKLKRELVSEVSASGLSKFLTGSIVLFSVNDKFKPGGALNEFATVTCPSVGDGCVSDYSELAPGSYEARITISPGTSLAGAAPAEIQLLVEQDRSGQVVAISSSNLIGEECSRSIALRFNAAKNSSYRIKVVSLTNINTTFSVVGVEYLKITDNQYSVNTGRHVLFGDSWFVFGGFLERLTERLPNAVIINKGVGGNKSSDLVIRYAADVVPERPDFLWLMCGTNDYGASNSLDTFDNNMNIIKSNNVGIGATTIAIDPSVGDITVGSNFELSRSYAIGAAYDEGSQAKAETFKFNSNQYSSGWDLAAGASVVVASSRKVVTKACELESSYFLGATGINLTIGYATNLVLAVEDTVIYGAETIQSTPIKLPKSSGAPRYLTATLTNTTGSPITITGFVKIKWN